MENLSYKKPVGKTPFHLYGLQVAPLTRLALILRQKATWEWPFQHRTNCLRFSVLTFLAFANGDPAEPTNHDYNVLEGPGETGDEVDERLKDSISRDPDQTSEDSDSSLEPSKIFNMEDNPAYAKPWKAKGDPELALEPSDFLNIEHNPAYSTPWKTNTAEPCLKRRAYSL